MDDTGDGGGGGCKGMKGEGGIRGDIGMVEKGDRGVQLIFHCVFFLCICFSAAPFRSSQVLLMIQRQIFLHFLTARDQKHKVDYGCKRNGNTFFCKERGQSGHTENRQCTSY